MTKAATMGVQLINYTKDAEDILIFTKQTRLTLSPGLLDEIKNWPQEKKIEELKYMASTIKSSWEFVDFTFLVSGVTRACAQQMTRTRNASYAMQSQRVTNASEMSVTNPYPDDESINGDRHRVFDDVVYAIKEAYTGLVDGGAKLEDARGILPMNTQCNLIAKYNLRSLSDLIKARKSLRAQGEYNEIVLQMEQKVIEVFPWAKEFFISDQQIAIEMLEAVAKEIGIKVGDGAGWKIAKAIDLLRK